MMSRTTAQPQATPRDEDACAVARLYAGADSLTIRRYPTGLCHYVYEVVPRDGTPFVVRMARPDLGRMLRSANYWSNLLRPLGIPLPKTLAIDLEADFPYMILERLEGKDLGDVYPHLSSPARRAIAHAVASWQSVTAGLPEAKGFGFGASFDDPSLVPTWIDFLNAHCDRTRQWMKEGGVGDPSLVDRVQEALYQERAYLDDILPRPFLDDTTTKNVLVSEQGAHGVVDVDAVCFGDRLYVLSLTNMAFISSSFDREYIDYWIEAWDLSGIEKKMLRLYTAGFCASFIAEMGMRFNKEVARVDPHRKAFLEATFEGLLGSTS